MVWQCQHPTSVQGDDQKYGQCRAVQIKQKTNSPALLEWLKQTEHEASSPLASATGRLNACAKALFLAGSKSLTHSDTYLQRYRDLIHALQADVPAQVRFLGAIARGHVPRCHTTSFVPGAMENALRYAMCFSSKLSKIARWMVNRICLLIWDSLPGTLVCVRSSQQPAKPEAAEYTCMQCSPG